MHWLRGPVGRSSKKNTLQTELDSLRAAQETNVGESKQQADQSNKTINELQQQLKDVQDQLAQNKTPTGTVTTPAVAATTATAVAASSSPQNDAVERIRQQINNPEFRAMAIERAVEMRYGSFIATLKLPPQDEKMLKTRIKEALIHGDELSQKVSRGEMTREELQASWDAAAEIRKIMADYTKGDQQGAYAEFEAQIPEKEKQQARNLLKNTSMTMINMQAPGLTEENKNLVASMLADATFNPAGPLPAGADPNPSVRRFQSVEAQLQGKLTDDQMKIAKEFLQGQIQAARAYSSGR